MYERRESEYYTAKMKAARYVFKGWVKPADLPSNVEIRDELEALARLYEGDNRCTGRPADGHRAHRVLDCGGRLQRQRRRSHEIADPAAKELGLGLHRYSLPQNQGGVL